MAHYAHEHHAPMHHDIYYGASPASGPSHMGPTPSPTFGEEPPNPSGADVNANIRVCVRVRPMSDLERRRGDPIAISSLPDRCTLQVGDQKGGARNFTYDTAFEPLVSQSDVFDQSEVADLIDSAFQGYSSTVFAYGCTGCGKTYTMTGPEDLHDRNFNSSSRGIIPRSAHYIFERYHQLCEQDPSTRYTIRACYLEIYNEMVNDLLNPAAVNLPVRWNAQRGFFVENLLVVDCTTVEDLMAVISEGSKNRKVGAHELNKDSSRSHSMVTVYLDATDLSGGAPAEHAVVRYGKIHFVDLAGSERLKESKSSGEMVQETGHINKSLLTLGKVISILGDPRQRGSFVPYRDSKLTKLLMDSIGGSSRSLMIACVTPSATGLEESLNTLKYASRAKNIKNKPVVHVDARDQLLLSLRDEIRALREENMHLKGGGMPLGSLAPPLLPPAYPQPHSSQMPISHSALLAPHLPARSPQKQQSSPVQQQQTLLPAPLQPHSHPMIAQPPTFAIQDPRFAPTRIPRASATVASSSSSPAAASVSPQLQGHSSHFSGQSQQQHPHHFSSPTAYPALSPRLAAQLGKPPLPPPAATASVSSSVGAFSISHNQIQIAGLAAPLSTNLNLNWGEIQNHQPAAAPGKKPLGNIRLANPLKRGGAEKKPLGIINPVLPSMGGSDAGDEYASPRSDAAPHLPLAPAYHAVPEMLLPAALEQARAEAETLRKEVETLRKDLTRLHLYKDKVEKENIVLSEDNSRLRKQAGIPARKPTIAELAVLESAANTSVAAAASVVPASSSNQPLPPSVEVLKKQNEKLRQNAVRVQEENVELTKAMYSMQEMLVEKAGSSDAVSVLQKSNQELLRRIERLEASEKAIRESQSLQASFVLNSSNASTPRIDSGSRPGSSSSSSVILSRPGSSSKIRRESSAVEERPQTSSRQPTPPITSRPSSASSRQQLSVPFSTPAADEVQQAQEEEQQQQHEKPQQPALADNIESAIEEAAIAQQNVVEESSEAQRKAETVVDEQPNHTREASKDGLVEEEESELLGSADVAITPDVPAQAEEALQQQQKKDGDDSSGVEGVKDHDAPAPAVDGSPIIAASPSIVAPQDDSPVSQSLDEVPMKQFVHRTPPPEEPSVLEPAAPSPESSPALAPSPQSVAVPAESVAAPLEPVPVPPEPIGSSLSSSIPEQLEQLPLPSGPAEPAVADPSPESPSSSPSILPPPAEPANEEIAADHVELSPPSSPPDASVDEAQKNEPAIAAPDAPEEQKEANIQSVESEKQQNELIIPKQHEASNEEHEASTPVSVHPEVEKLELAVDSSSESLVQQVEEMAQASILPSISESEPIAPKQDEDLKHDSTPSPIAGDLEAIADSVAPRPHSAKPSVLPVV